MIEFRCPDCDKRLRAPDKSAGRLVACTGCKAHIRVPEKDSEEDVPDARVAKTPPRQKRQLDEDPVPVRKRRRAEDDDSRSDDEDEDKEERPRRKKKKKRQREEKREESGFGLPLGLDALTAGFLATVVVGLLCLVLGIVSHGLAGLPFGVGSLLTLAGVIWLVVIAFQDDVKQGFLCLVCGPYALVYAIMNLGETWMPFSLLILGLVMQLIAGAIDPELANQLRGRQN